MRAPAVALAGLTGWLSLGAAPGASLPPAAGAAGTAGAAEHRAAVIVDTGAQVKQVCVRFPEDAISGTEALVRAGVDPVFRAYPGKGSAVCALCGTGCPADESCLTCDPDGRYWAYHRATAGTTTFRSSSVGASGTEVRDGDVEGWRWGLGSAPAFASVEQVCGEAGPTATTTAATTTPAPTSSPATAAGTAAPATGPAAGPARRPATTEATAAPPRPATTVAPAHGDAPAPGPATTDRGAGSDTTAGDLAARAERGGGEDGAGSPARLAAFAVMLAGLVGWAVWARRSRGRPPS